MASATVDSSVCNCQNHLHTESLPLIDLHHLSQSELLSLSFCSSSSSLSINRLQTDTADVSTPKIDRTVFNESAGSRKQTFSRLRLAPRTNNTNASSSSSTPVAPYQITERPYLDEENKQIISLLKSLFGSDSQSIENENHDNLVSVPIIYNDYMCLSLVKDAELQNVPISIADSSRELKGLEANYSISTPMAESNSIKRKRGRPRKNDKLEEENVEKKTVVAFDNVGVENQKKEEMMIVNNNGVMVDLVALGNMEDPYGEELRRRTEGMGTKEELLGFLEGFDGEWGSVRKKRRVVDASFFGDALPVGWKLLVCVKKQGGRVWLDCTRYISPNGQQFMSCKEVSSNLLSFSGHHDANQSNTSRVDGRIQLTENSADHTLRGGKQENDFVCYKTLPISCKFIETGGCLGEGQTRKKYKCHKCTMSFDEQDDLLQHLLLSHQRTPMWLKCGQSTNEAIVKNGKYECQFCRKLFEERHRFNGHLGNHIKDYLRRLDTSTGIITQKSDQYAALERSPDPVKIQTPIGIDRGSGAITSSNKANHEITSAVMYCEMKENTSVENCYGEQDRVFDISIDKVGKTNEATDVAAAENSVCSELALLNNKSNASHRSSDGTDAFECPANGIDDFGREDKCLKSCSLASGGRHLACLVCNSSKQISPGLIDKFSSESGFKSGSWAPTAKENTSNDEIFEDRHCSSTIDNLVIDVQNTVGTGELRTGFHDGSVAMAENSAANVKEQRDSEGCSVADDVTGLSTSIVVESMQEKGSTGNLSCIESDRNIVCAGILNKGKFDYVDRSGNNELTIGSDTVPVEDSVARIEPGISPGHCSVISFSNDDMHVLNNMTVNPSCTSKKPCQVKVSEGGLHTTSGNKPSFGSDSNLVKDSNGTINVSKHDKVQCSVNSEIDLVVQSVTNIEQDRSSNIFSFFPSTNGLASASKKGICNNTGKLRPVRNFGHTPSLNEQTLDDENGTNVASCIIVEESQDKEAKTSCNGELHIALGDSCTGQDTDVVTSSVQEGCVLFPGNQHKFTPKDNATCPYSDSVDKLNQKLGSVESSLCLSCREPVQGLEKNLHVAFTGSVQESGLGNLDNTRNVESGINFSRPSGTKENVISDFLRRPSAGNNLPTGFADISSQPEQTPGCLQHDEVSHKSESECFGEKLGGISGFGGPKSENIEHNFLTSQASSHSDDSKFGSNEAAIARGFDSSTWLEKEDLPCMPNNVSRQHVPTVCVWCGSELCQEALESEGQTNTMGFICAHCSAKLSRQFNVQ